MFLLYLTLNIVTIAVREDGFLLGSGQEKILFLKPGYLFFFQIRKAKSYRTNGEYREKEEQNQTEHLLLLLTAGVCDGIQKLGLGMSSGQGVDELPLSRHVQTRAGKKGTSRTFVFK